ncbi:hypothetical protein Tsubulata_028743 [Turnera subulata]|uniref:Uncharacterized protein n=1 Tax=Turnera subulata TaxID=218843 RepID=A0A9Q0GME1_9ROSI|nr:hypothetical protein Tsubulata_028743 [Turnera subulata]
MFDAFVEEAKRKIECRILANSIDAASKVWKFPAEESVLQEDMAQLRCDDFKGGKGYRVLPKPFTPLEDMIFNYATCIAMRDMYIDCVTSEDPVNCRRFCRQQMRQHGCKGALGLHLDLSDEGKM